MDESLTITSWKRSRDLFDNNNNDTRVLVPTLVEDEQHSTNNHRKQQKVIVNIASRSTSTSTVSKKYVSNPPYYLNLLDASIQRRRRMKLQQLGISTTDAIQLTPFPVIGGGTDRSATTKSTLHSTNTQQIALLQNESKTKTSIKSPPAVSSSALTLLSTNENTSGSVGSNKRTTGTGTGGGGGGGVLLPLEGNSNTSTSVPTPQWHSPWKLSTVLSSHLGWVRCIGFAPDNTMFATGSADRTIKIWNLPKASVGSSDALQLTLTGHISPVRSVVFSPRHPYLFTCGEDKTVKCWDLETNQVVRHYHGHLSGVYSLSLHPILDILVSAGRDAVGRVWDIRTKRQIHLLSGHDHTISCVQTKSTHPQVITSSHDCTIKLWDLAAGKCFTTLTHHNKAVRSLALPTFENTFISGSTDYIKKWQGKDGKFLHNISPLPVKKSKNDTSSNSIVAQRDVICHTVSVNDDGVIVSGYDDGTIQLYDYTTGYNYQTINSIVQPGSLQQAENAVLTSCFDLTGTRLITGEADKSIKIYKQLPTASSSNGLHDDDNDNDDYTISTNATTNNTQYASEYTHPINMKGWRKQYMASLKERL
jgi:pleiotropic regulator 1